MPKTTVVFGVLEFRADDDRPIIVPIRCSHRDCRDSAAEHVREFLRRNIGDLRSRALDAGVRAVKTEVACWQDECEHGVPLLRGYRERWRATLHVIQRSRGGLVAAEHRPGSHVLRSRSGISQWEGAAEEPDEGDPVDAHFARLFRMTMP